MGKVIAQHAFADAAAASGGWDADHGLPGRQRRADPVGPPAARGPWQHLIERMLEGHCEIFQGTGPYRPWMTVDVRDDAACHVGLLESERRQRRALPRLVDGDPPYEDIAAIDRVLPELRHDPGAIADKSPDRWKAREEEFRSIWAGLSCATTASAPPCR